MHLWEEGVTVRIVLCKSLQWEGAEERPFSDYGWSCARMTFSSEYFFLRKCWILQKSFRRVSLQRSVNPILKLGVSSHFQADSSILQSAAFLVWNLQHFYWMKIKISNSISLQTYVAPLCQREVHCQWNRQDSLTAACIYSLHLLWDLMPPHLLHPDAQPGLQPHSVQPLAS